MIYICISNSVLSFVYKAKCLVFIPLEAPSSESLCFQVDTEHDAALFSLCSRLQGSFTQEEITAVGTLISCVWCWHLDYLEYLYAIFLKSC